MLESFLQEVFRLRVSFSWESISNEKSNSIKVALDELRGDYFNSKRLQLFLIHKIKPSEPTINLALSKILLAIIKFPESSHQSQHET